MQATIDAGLAGVITRVLGKIDIPGFTSVANTNNALARTASVAILVNILLSG